MLAARGAFVINTDDVARDVLAPGGAGERAVLERFGPSVRTTDGVIDRSALARRVFSVPADRLALEAITHPLIKREVEARLAALEPASPRLAGDCALEPGTYPQAGAHVPGAGASREAQPDPPIAVLEIPLLDRARRREYRLDVVVLLEAPEEVALRHAGLRGFSEDDARARLAVQPSPEERRASADRVLTNSGDLGQLERSVNELWEWLIQQAKASMHTS